MVIGSNVYTLKGKKAAMGYTVIRCTLLDISDYFETFVVLCENKRDKISPYVCWIARLEKETGEVSYESGVYSSDLESGFGWYEKRGGS